MSKDKEKRAEEFIYSAFSIVPNELGAEESFKRACKTLNNILRGIEVEAEVSYTMTLETIKGYLTSRGLALPLDFKTFYKWYVVRHGNLVDELGFLGITQHQINEYSRELTAKLDYTPLFKYQTPLMQNPDKLYYLTPPHDGERLKELRQFIVHIHNRVNEEVKGLIPYHFDIHRFLSMQGITADLKAELLAEVRNTLSWFPKHKRADIEQIRAIINDYQPPQADITEHPTESLNIDQILQDIFPDITDSDLNSLKTNLLRRGAVPLWNLYYVGIKRTLWHKLGKLSEAGVKRDDIARVFDVIYWKKSAYGSAPKKLEYDEIYSKIDKRGIKR